VLVDAAAVPDPAFEGGECCREEPGLLQQAFGAAIGVPAGLQRSADDAVERVDRPPAAPQLVVEPQHRREQPGPKTERRRRTRACGVVGGQPQQDLAIEVRQQTRTVRQMRLQSCVKLLARQQIRQHHDSLPGAGKRQVFDGAPQLLGGGPARHDDRGAARVPSMRHEAGDRRLEGPEIGGAKQPGDAWGDQRVGCGARVMRRSSSVA
jgi:hypothetical protein